MDIPLAHSQSRQLLWLLIGVVLAVVSNSAAYSQQRYQATSLSFLTELPEREGVSVQVASQQKPNEGELKVSDKARITPPFAYNRSDKYVAPDCESFFPDDPAGGKQLDALFSGSLGGHHKPEDVLAAIRQGLRHTQVYHSQLLAQVGGFVWGVKEQNPQAIELLYHASDSRGPNSYDGMYYGLTVLKHRPSNVVQTLVNNYDSFSGELQHRIGWGLETYGNASQFAAELDKLLEQPERLSDNAVIAALGLYERAAGKRSSKIDALADRGRFVVGFTHHDSQDDQALREHLDRYVEAKSILLVDTPDWKASLQPENAVGSIPDNYAEAFEQLYRALGGDYAHFEVKQIDWKAVGAELLPRSKTLKTRDEYCLLCQELVARLEDSHASLMPGKLQPTPVPVPLFDPGFACLLDADERPIVYHVDPQSSAQQAGLKVGSVVLHVNGMEATKVLDQIMTQTKRYTGYSSDRYLKYHAAQWLGRQMEKGAPVTLNVIQPGGTEVELKTIAESGVRYLPRLPVPINGITDSASIDWTRLDEKIGYIYVRQIRNDLITQLDSAVKELSDCKGLIIDVRGNSGGGFDAARSVRNFDVSDNVEPDRPKFAGPIAVLIDSRCISAGEGWVSWFRANGRAKFFGTTTAGASSRKNTIDILGGAYRVIYSVKAYRGFLDRPIERLGIEPDVIVHHKAESIANGKDEVLEAARGYFSQLKD